MPGAPNIRDDRQQGGARPAFPQWQEAPSGPRTQYPQRDNVQRPAASVRPDNGANPRDTRQGPQPWLDPRSQDRTTPPPHNRDPAQRNDWERNR